MNNRLLNEIQYYAKKMHAESVFKKCKKAGKQNLAMKIAAKYNLNIERPLDDFCLAFGLAIHAKYPRP